MLKALALAFFCDEVADCGSGRCTLVGDDDARKATFSVDSAVGSAIFFCCAGNRGE